MNTFDILKEATASWTVPVLVRTYEGEQAQAAYQEEAQVLGRHGYAPQAQTEDGGHVHVGRLLATAGWSVLAGRKGIRSDPSLTVTYTRTAPTRSWRVLGDADPSRAPQPVSDVDSKVCPDCAESVKLAARICRYCRHEFWAEGADPYDALIARERELVDLTEGWTKSTVTRTYDMTDDGDEDAKDDGCLLGAHGYAMQARSEFGSKRSIVYRHMR